MKKFVAVLLVVFVCFSLSAATLISEGIKQFDKSLYTVTDSNRYYTWQPIDTVSATVVRSTEFDSQGSSFVSSTEFDGDISSSERSTEIGNISTSVSDIPIDWYIQIVKVLNNFTAKDYEEWKFERIDEKTLKISNSKPAVIKDKDGERESWEAIKEYYFRFNLSLEEEKNDRVLLMGKVGEMFSSGVGNPLSEISIDNNSYGEYDLFTSYFREFFNSDAVRGNRTTTLEFYYELENYTSLSHYFYYQCISDMTYYKK